MANKTANLIQTLLDLKTTDGAGDYKAFSRGNGEIPITDNAYMDIFGVWGGATVKFTKKATDSEATDFDIPIYDGAVELAITSNRMVRVSLYSGEEIRAVVSGATGTTKLTVHLYEGRNA